MIRTYSTAQVAEALVGDSMLEGERWVIRQITAGRFTARRVGRQWRMTDADIDHALEVLANKATPAAPTAAPTPTADQIGRPSAASMRRRLAVAQ